MNAIEKIIDEINTGDIENLLPFFSSIKNLVIFLIKKNLIDHIDLSEFGDYENEFFYELISNSENPDKYYKYIVNKFLNDVTVSENDYYYFTNYISSLSDLFKSYSRETSPHDIVKSILDDEIWEPFWDTTEDVYRDVIEDLNPENKNILKNYILENLKGVEIELDGTSSEEMELIASEQGHDEYIEVNEENIDRILNDEDTMNFLLEDELSDLKSELYSVHSNAYNSAYYSLHYDKVWDSLLTYFDNPPKWNGNTASLKVTNSIKKIIYDFLEYNRNNENSISYQGSFKNILFDLLNTSSDYDFLSFTIYDYPYHRDVIKNINEYFKDYI